MKKAVIPAAALALTGAAVWLASTNVLCADESAHDAVERLMPQLLSDDAATRAEAEKQVFALGEAGRSEMERITRESDTRRAVTALRMLQSPKWQKAPTRAAPKPGEERVHGNDATKDDEDDGANLTIDGRDLRAQIEKLKEQMRLHFQDFDKGFELGGPGFEMKSGQSGTVVQNDKKTTWKVDQDGSVKVTIQDGKDAAEQSFEAKSWDDFKKEHPDVAQRVEPLMGRGGGGNFVFRFGGKDGRGLRDFNLDRDRNDDPFRFDAARTQVLGVEWSPVPDVLREQLDLAGGMVVESVVPGSLAEKLGLARFDVLVEVDGHAVAGSPDVRAALENAKTGDKVTAVVVRKGKKQSLETTK